MPDPLEHPMQAVELTAAGVQYRTDYPEPEPRPGEALVRVTCAGICETDLQLIRGYMGFHGVLGHEFVGVAQSGEFAGRRVVGEINCACRTCPTCRRGLPTHCPHRTVLGILGRDGAFADLVAVPEVNLHAVPDDLPDDVAVFTEPTAAALQILTQVAVQPHHEAVILGDGRLGNLCAQVLAGTGCRLTVVGKHRHKLALLERRGIATLDVHAPPERRADIVVDCTGSATGFPAALAWLQPCGTLVLKTTVAGQPPTSLAPLVIDEIRVVGSRCGPFAPALEALAERRVVVDDLISARRPLSEAPRALSELQDGRQLKVLLTP